MSPIVSVDEDYDRDYAADGISRFGGYVRQRAHLFVDDWEPLSPVTFAVTVWTVANGPVMSPGYVRIRESIGGVSCRHGDEPGLLLAEVDIRLPWPAAMHGAECLGGWGSWSGAGSAVDDESGQPDERRPALLVSARLRIPIPEALLPVPSRFAGLDVSVAKRAVAVICEQVNAHAGPAVASLRSYHLSGAAR
jgi:hypothetical protein